MDFAEFSLNFRRSFFMIRPACVLRVTWCRCGGLPPFRLFGMTRHVVPRCFPVSGCFRDFQFFGKVELVKTTGGLCQRNTVHTLTSGSLVLPWVSLSWYCMSLVRSLTHTIASTAPRTRRSRPVCSVTC